MNEYQTTSTEDAIKEVLRQFGIPVDRWGSGSAKTVANLLDEIEAGETTLVKDEQELLRKTGFVALNIICQGTDGVLELYKKEQIFSDGRRRKRNMNWSAGEKLLRGENPNVALERLLYKEELVQIAKGITGIAPIGETQETKESPSYPGLKTEFIRYSFSGELEAAFFKSEGYILEESDKTTYFAWRPRKPE